MNDGSGDSDARADAFREEVRAALPLLLAGVPLAFTIEEPFGANKDGESVRLLPQARFASTSAGPLTAGLDLDEEVARVTWRYAAHVHGMEGSVARTPVGSLWRVTRNILVGKPGRRSFDETFRMTNGSELPNERWVDDALATILSSRVEGCELLVASLINVRVRPGASLSVTCRTERRAASVARSFAVAEAVRAHWLPERSSAPSKVRGAGCRVGHIEVGEPGLVPEPVSSGVSVGLALREPRARRRSTMRRMPWLLGSHRALAAARAPPARPRPVVLGGSGRRAHRCGTGGGWGHQGCGGRGGCGARGCGALGCGAAGRGCGDGFRGGSRG